MHPFGPGFEAIPLWIISVAALIIVWGYVWKGLALWHAARRNQAWWFVVFLLINTVGILELIYLFLVLKLKISALFRAEK